MKIYKSLLIGVVVSAGMLTVTSCNDYDYDSQLSRTDITGTFSVKNDNGNVYTSSIDGDNITIKINPYANVEVELSNAYPVFFLPMGATCSPSPVEPQDFTKEVKYTITSGDGKNTRVYTVTWGPSDPLPAGEGYAFTRLSAEKLYTDLGYPGANVTGTAGAEANGDLLFFPAFCGDYVVGFSRVYAWGNTNSASVAANPNLAILVWDANTLEPVNKTLNLGSLNAGQIVNICNDWTGHVVAATGGLNGADSEVYYWTSLDAAPVKVGKLPTAVYTNSHQVDASMFIQVAGDITGDAVITYMPTKTAEGNHIVVKVRGGVMDQTYSTITTGYPSNDKAWFQMISLFGTGDNANYLVGETEGEGNGSVKVYYNSHSGMTLYTMPAHLNGKAFTDGVTWWSATGKSSNRGGARRPFVMAMVINGKEYSLVLTGYDWSNRSQMMTGDLQTYTGDALCYDMRRLELAVIGAAGLNASDSFGGCGCWYWNDEAHEGHIAIWNGREGLATFLVSSYE